MLLERDTQLPVQLLNLHQWSDGALSRRPPSHLHPKVSLLMCGIEGVQVLVELLAVLHLWDLCDEAFDLTDQYGDGLVGAVGKGSGV